MKNQRKDAQARNEAQQRRCFDASYENASKSDVSLYEIMKRAESGAETISLRLCNFAPLR